MYSLSSGKRLRASSSSLAALRASRAAILARLRAGEGLLCLIMRPFSANSGGGRVIPRLRLRRLYSRGGSVITTSVERALRGAPT
eukprot:XP_001707483.1 Hypothetical protein GL50803_34152 [Giardia lamblia ATCC 50803]